MKKSVAPVVVFLIGVTLGAGGEEPPRFPDVQESLAKHNFTTIHHFRQWRRDMIQTIRRTIEKRASEDSGQPQGNETHISIVWAGELRATELTSLLIKHIDFKVGFKELLAYEDSYPAVRALIVIDKGATAPCMSALSSEKDAVRRKNLCLVIRRVEGEDAATVLIRDALRQQKREEQRR